MSRKIGRVLSIDIIQHAGAHSRGRIRHNGRRYTLFGAFSGVQSCCADRARSERYYGCPSGTHYGSSAFPRPWGVPGPKIWRNIASGGTIQNCTPGVTHSSDHLSVEKAQQALRRTRLEGVGTDEGVGGEGAPSRAWVGMGGEGSRAGARAGEGAGEVRAGRNRLLYLRGRVR